MPNMRYTERQLADWLEANGPIGGGTGMEGVDMPMDDVDPGTPREYGNEPIETGKPEPTPTEKALETLREENARQSRELNEQRELAQFWSTEAKKPAAREPEPDTRQAADDGPDLSGDTPDQMLDDLSTEGVKALEKRGLITVKRMNEMLADLEERVTNRLAHQAEGADYDRQMATQYPELASDHNKIQAWVDGGKRGTQPETGDLYKRTGQIYQELMGDGAGIAPEVGRKLLTKAAQIAARELGTVSDTRQSREDERSDRIAAQRGGRARGGSEDERGRPGMNNQQSEVAKRLGVSPEEFSKQVEKRAARARN